MNTNNDYQGQLVYMDDVALDQGTQIRTLPTDLGESEKRGIVPPLRVGFLGCPARAEVEWNDQHLLLLKDMGFNTLQLNIAWGSRPGKEALNLEDLVDLSTEYIHLAGKTVMLGDQTPEVRQWRRMEMQHRIELCKKHGFRTIFHFGAPYIGDQYIKDAPDNCLLDDKTQERCLRLLETFAQEYPGVDDLLMYTYDQHAWLCSEFGPCPRCTGIPLHERVIPFLEAMAAQWLACGNPEGRLWWEPWELSAGQVLTCVSIINPVGFGLSLHCNIAEVMGTIPVDRWLKNTVALAAQRGIPSMAEYWLGAASEEIEPYTCISYPLTTLHGLRELTAVPGLAGIKEYYGLLPDQEDPNLRMTSLFLNNPDIGDEQALTLLSEAYGDAAELVIKFWRLTSEAMDLFPWEVSWLIRAIGTADPNHSLSAAIVRGVPWHTPSWASTRRSIFMVVDTMVEPDPWMLEDIQLRCKLSADRMAAALLTGHTVLEQMNSDFREYFAKGLEELREWMRRTLAYVYHARETNLATLMREFKRQGRVIPDSLKSEMQAVLEADQANQEQLEPLATALALLNNDIDRFLDTYFVDEDDTISKGHTSLTSR